MQPGGWYTIDIETNFASFHIKYRQNLPDKNVAGRYNSNKIDVCMSKVSPKIENQKRRGIFGETHYIKKYKGTGSEIINGRYLIVVGGRDSDYEVSGPCGTNFIMMYMSPWYQEA